MRDWPGLAGPLVHVPDPLAPTPFIDSVAELICPRWRVMSISPRAGVPYQVSATDLRGLMLQFGFEDPIVLGEGLGCVTALLLGAWYPEHVCRLIFARATWHVGGDSLEAQALRDCPPDLQALRHRVRCQVTDAGSAEEVAATLP